MGARQARFGTPDGCINADKVSGIVLHDKDENCYEHFRDGRGRRFSPEEQKMLNVLGKARRQIRHVDSESCRNQSPISTEEFNEDEYYFRDDTGYCFSKRDLQGIGRSRNPYTNRDFTDNEIAVIYGFSERPPFRGLVAGEDFAISEMIEHSQGPTFRDRQVIEAEIQQVQQRIESLRANRARVPQAMQARFDTMIENNERRIEELHNEIGDLAAPPAMRPYVPLSGAEVHNRERQLMSAYQIALRHLHAAEQKISTLRSIMSRYGTSSLSELIQGINEELAQFPPNMQAPEGVDEDATEAEVEAWEEAWELYDLYKTVTGELAILQDIEERGVGIDVEIVQLESSLDRLQERVDDASFRIPHIHLDNVHQVTWLYQFPLGTSIEDTHNTTPMYIQRTYFYNSGGTYVNQSGAERDGGQDSEPTWQTNTGYYLATLKDLNSVTELSVSVSVSPDGEVPELEPELGWIYTRRGYGYI